MSKSRETLHQYLDDIAVLGGGEREPLWRRERNAGEKTPEAQARRLGLMLAKVGEYAHQHGDSVDLLDLKRPSDWLRLRIQMWPRHFDITLADGENIWLGEVRLKSGSNDLAAVESFKAWEIGDKDLNGVDLDETFFLPDDGGLDMSALQTAFGDHANDVAMATAAVEYMYSEHFMVERLEAEQARA